MTGGWRFVEVFYTIKDARENIEVSVDWKDSKLDTIFKKEEMKLWQLPRDYASVNTRERVGL